MPFSYGKSPSFTVSPDKQMYYCFGCGIGGDAVSFLMKINGLSFGEAIRYLAEKTGITLAVNGEEGERKDPRELLYAANHCAMDAYREALRSGRGREARRYLAQRGISEDTAREFALGYAPEEWQWLVERIKRAGFSPQLAVQAGLIIARGTDRYYDRFRGRLIFPIYDLLGKVVAFGGRELGNGTPKYLNSPETPIYVKGQVLYGLNAAREAIRREGQTIVVEGYFDLLSLWERGVKNVVATLGTALTTEHVALLRRYASRAIVVFDGDEAGRKALKRSVSLFLKGEVEMKVIVLPEGYDPDTYIQSFGVEGWQEMMHHAQPAVEYYVDEVMKAAHDMQGERAALKEAMDFVRLLPSAAERHLFIRRIAQRLNLDERLLAREVVSSAASAQGLERRGAQERDKGGDPLELKLLSFMLEGGVYLERAKQAQVTQLLADDRLKGLVSEIEDHHRQGKEVDPISITASLEAALRDRLLKWVLGRDPGDPNREREFADTIKRLREKWYHRSCKELNLQIQQAQSQGDEARCRVLLAQKGRLMKEVQAIRNLTGS